MELDECLSRSSEAEKVMGTCTCVNCQETVSRNQAHIRSVAFRQVAYCATCWNELYPPEVPRQRQSADELAEA
jgi:hypothetical protein